MINERYGVSHEQAEINRLREQVQQERNLTAGMRLERDRALRRVSELEIQVRGMSVDAQETVKLRNRLAVLEQSLGALGVRT